MVTVWALLACFFAVPELSSQLVAEAEAAGETTVLLIAGALVSPRYC